MTTIFEKVKTALDTLSPAVPFSQAPYKTTSGALPDAYIAFQLITDDPEQHADDAETLRSALMQITIWDRSGAFSAMSNVDTVMVTAGFMKGRKRQLPQDPQTSHYGLAMEYRYF